MIRNHSPYTKWLVNSTLVVMLIAMLFFACLMIFPRTIVRINKVSAETKVVKSGGTLIYDFDYCKFRDQDGVVYRELRSTKTSTVINLPIVSTVSVPGCHVAKVYTLLPQGIPAGEYILHGDNIYRVNGLRTITQPFDTDRFMIE